MIIIVLSCSLGQVLIGYGANPKIHNANPKIIIIGAGMSGKCKHKTKTKFVIFGKLLIPHNWSP